MNSIDKIKKGVGMIFIALQIHEYSNSGAHRRPVPSPTRLTALEVGIFELSQSSHWYLVPFCPLVMDQDSFTHFFFILYIIIIIIIINWNKIKKSESDLETSL